jgi:DNA mismatch repair protein MutS2
MDELGTGTDPGEGSALALATVDFLRALGARVMATTHLHVVKGYAQLEDLVENAAVEFDTQTLQPTYRLHYGIPGASHAFTIAQRIGLPEDLLAAADRYLGQDEREGGAIIERLQAVRATLDEELHRARSLRSSAEAEKHRIHDDRKALDARRREILEDARQQGIKILTAAEEKLQEIFRKVPQEAVVPRERAELTRTVRTLRESLPEPLPQGPQRIPEEVAVRELLYLPALGVEAEVTHVDGDRIELQAGGKKLRQPRQALRQFEPRRFAEQRKSAPKVRDRVERKAFLPRLVLVGKRVEDAQGLLGRFLDEALLHGEQELEIVHGAGQGILRKAVREFLAARGEVSVFHAAGPEQGGDNVTVVELRH